MSAAFVLYSRERCGLCEDMQVDLEPLARAAGLGLEVVDVDQDPELAARYGHKVPVLLLGGDLVCRGHLDLAEVHKAIAHHCRPV